MYDKGDIALFGDFNARVAVDVDFIPNDNCSKFMPDEHYIEDVPCTTRESQDQILTNKLNSETTKLFPLPLRYKWTDGSISKFQEALACPSVASKLEEFNNCNISLDKNGIEKAVVDMNNCILEAANISLKARKGVMRKNNKKKKKTMVYP
ncbi:Hypothetical predicted protein [Mytilus galloprovincialis]|uniref:Endonuclease/exonuclease/phosphatase domain-containing protein n=1 Tax=Mytilus galloprovincialis TaxID=29158 RepID=A0A8B6HIS6_MYTGA|nr:Hypothetical predicted protein [Mytilus galloprovincialis]